MERAILGTRASSGRDINASRFRATAVEIAPAASRGAHIPARQEGASGPRRRYSARGAPPTSTMRTAAAMRTAKSTAAAGASISFEQVAQQGIDLLAQRRFRESRTIDDNGKNERVADA